MILLLGASGHIGKTFATELRRRGQSFIPLTRKAFDYTRFDYLFDYMRTMRPVFLINAAGYSGGTPDARPDVERETSMAGNALLPQMIARVCLMTRTPWAHISSGSIYSGGKVFENGRPRIERDLSNHASSERFEAHPEEFLGFSEQDEPNFCFRCPPCSFYSGAKALAEESIRDIGQNYIWRFRHPFNERDEPSNLLMRLGITGLSGPNSFSHLEDCVRACLDLWERRAEFGIYNVTNPGAVSVEPLLQRVHRATRLGQIQMFRPDTDGEEPADPETPRSNCILDSSKLVRAGIVIRPLSEALQDTLERMSAAVRAARVSEGAGASPHRLPTWISATSS